MVQRGPPNTQSLKLMDTPTADMLRNPTSMSESIDFVKIEYTTTVYHLFLNSSIIHRSELNVSSFKRRRIDKKNCIRQTLPATAMFAISKLAFFFRAGRVQ